MMGREGIVFAVVSFSFSNATSSGGRLSFFSFILLFSGSSFSLPFFFFLSRVHSLSLSLSFSLSLVQQQQTSLARRELYSGNCCTAEKETASLSFLLSLISRLFVDGQYTVFLSPQSYSFAVFVCTHIYFIPIVQDCNNFSPFSKKHLFGILFVSFILNNPPDKKNFTKACFLLPS